MNKHISLKTSYGMILSGGLSAILLLMPFHAGFAIVVGHFIGYQTVLQSWKEFLIILLVGVWLLFCWSKRKLLIKLDTTNWLFVSILVLSAIVTFFVHPLPAAVLFGLKTNIVAIVLFFVAQAPFSSKQLVRKYLLWLVLLPASVVAIAALLQSFVVPVHWLELVGYSQNTINPAQIVDGGLKFYRAFSSLGGPNQLGAYLILPIVFSIVYAIGKKRYWLFAVTALLLAAGVVTYSRSAWIGIAIGVLVALLISLKGRVRLAFVGLIVVLTIVGSGVAVWGLQQPTGPVQQVLLHGRIFQNQIEGSDQSRLQSFTDTTQVIIRQPFGHGLGSAGPASFYASSSVIPENWYLQIAYEIGVLGLVLYICAFAWLLGDFWRHRAQSFAAALFAVTVGILVCNLFLHAWADSTLALVMFSLYGLYKGLRA